LLPAIPTVLYGGLGRHQVERLSVMRKASERTWEHYAKGRSLPLDFDSFFQEVLSQFDTQADEFSPQRVQDELIGQMSELLGIDYDVLALDLTESESRHRALVSDPTPPSAPPALPEPGAIARPPIEPAPSPATAAHSAGHSAAAPTRPQDDAAPREASAATPAAAAGDLLDEHIVSPAPTTQRLQSIQRMVADQLGDALPPDFSANVLQSIPVQAGGLYPISDIWHIDPGLDAPGRLRVHIAQFAREIAGEVDLDACVEDRSDGIGFACRAPTQVSSPLARAVLALLVSLAGQQSADVGLDGGHFVTDLPALLHGQGQRHADGARRLSDTALVKLFRLLRLARRLLDLEAGALGPGT
ncbi:ParB family protein, partial [Pseudomonas aeruginosa]|nr:hypothetical protein [Pseudomonas aeruginosa]